MGDRGKNVLTLMALPFIFLQFFL